MKYQIGIGIVFALLAAFFNSTSGIFAKLLISGFSPGDIAFSKCLVAFVILGVWVVGSRRIARIDWSVKSILSVCACSFFGIFGLFTLETIAYEGLAAPLVVLSLIGTSTVTTLVLAHFVFGERLSRNTVCSLGLILLGFCLMMPKSAADPKYLVFAMCSGVCYGIFLVLAKRLRLMDGIEGIWLLIGAGALYLLPFASSPVTMLLHAESWKLLLPLALFPTIFGYFFTVKALNNAPASTVQLFEVSEPVFSAILAVLVLQEFLTSGEAIGSIVIIAALLSYHFKVFEMFRLRSGARSGE